MILKNLTLYHYPPDRNDNDKIAISLF